MKIKLNCDLLKYKKGTIIDCEKISYTEQVYFTKRIRDAKIDNCIEIVEEKKESKNNKKDKTSEEKSE